MKDADILKAIPLLSLEQLKVTQALIKRQLERYQAEDEAAVLVLGLINDALGLRVPITSVPPKWAEKAPVLTEFVDEHWPGVKKVARLGLCKLIMGLLIDDLKAKKLPMRFGLVWIHLVRVPQVFDDAFPGYREAGLCGLIVKAMGAAHET